MALATIAANPRAVMCEDGKLRVLTFNFSHINNRDNIKIGTIYKSGEIIYYEGTAGYASATMFILKLD